MNLRTRKVASMYQLGHKPHHRRKVILLLTVLLFVLIAGGAIWARDYFKPNTTLANSAAIIRHVDVATPKKKTVRTATFTMQVPADWKATTHSDVIPAPDFVWQGTTKEDTARWVQVWVDDIPSNMAVNRLLPLRPDGSRILLADDVSDNCVNFTDASKVDPRTGTVNAKWSGVDFTCDAANYERDLVGTATGGARNSITLHGPKSGTHRYFFIYTDHSAEADYSYFTDMLSSFRSL
jgi:hypothetical protein